MTTMTTMTTTTTNSKSKSNTRRTTIVASLLLLLATATTTTTTVVVDGFSLKPSTSAPSTSTTASTSTRRDFFSKVVGATAVTAAGIFAANPSPAVAAAAATSTAAAAKPQIYNLPSGIKYAVLKDTTKKGGYPQPGDIIAIEYTGYLTSGQIFDASHSEGKNNALLFKLGSTAVIPGINEMVSEMKVGQKVQAIIPPSSAFADKGICLENDDGGNNAKECLVKPGSTLVYDIYLKKASIPPP
mmetsp:Transcript_54942/g.133435  ORF Transcript_54942/g.133435 Transcript_54942/m.133435 type:complete len:243 (+) Transcript_54942:324-1052(+)|eukprot:CAMPEP_0113465044 /NCGR_PEP_ID=MMETSP0014_2-20120614/13526_1 /TAXON_ID=2857 /ORGANISM="Nitzschia sp." /LENGTH=242 /DNA_ID=CAMNT_0000357169 /DNA_START=323 /DNA_END=1051 /DNA_ORIENTATION=+ /assembly_acc=CAM_ASM_000159